MYFNQLILLIETSKKSIVTFAREIFQINAFIQIVCYTKKSNTKIFSWNKTL